MLKFPLLEKCYIDDVNTERKKTILEILNVIYLREGFFCEEDLIIKLVVRLLSNSKIMYFEFDFSYPNHIVEKVINCLEKPVADKIKIIRNHCVYGWQESHIIMNIKLNQLYQVEDDDFSHYKEVKIIDCVIVNNIIDFRILKGKCLNIFIIEKI